MPAHCSDTKAARSSPGKRLAADDGERRGLLALTGGTGFIGGALACALPQQGWRVRALTRRSETSRDTRVEWIKGDLSEPDALRRLVAGADAVIHCAGAVRGASASHFDCVNVEGSRQVAAAAAAAAAPPRLLLMSSLAAKRPDLSWYAASKRRAEDVVRTTAAGVPLTIFRPTAVYGPGDRELRPLLALLRRGLLPVPGSGGSTLTLLHVDDLVRAVTLWLNAPVPASGTFELHDGTAGGYAWETIAAIGARVYARPVRRLHVPWAILSACAAINLRLARALGSAPMLTPGKLNELRRPDWRCDNAALHTALGWRPEIDLERALRDELHRPPAARAQHTESRH